MTDLAERSPDTYWSGKPVYRCRVCGRRYARVGIGNLADVLRHEAEAHAPAPPVSRPSLILGTNGEPLTIEREEP